MKIRMLTIAAGPDCYHDVGEVLDVDQADADILIAARSAEPVEDAPPSATPETAEPSAAAAEVATLRNRRRKS